MEHKGFEIVRDQRIQTAWEIKYPQGGNISNDLKGMFTSLHDAQLTVDRYLLNKEEKIEQAKSELRYAKDVADKIKAQHDRINASVSMEMLERKAEENTPVKAPQKTKEKVDAKTKASSSDSKLPEGKDNGSESSELSTGRVAVGK
jgi:hypothetical protein